jgi:hypothetical protein
VNDSRLLLWVPGTSCVIVATHCVIDNTPELWPKVELALSHNKGVGFLFPQVSSTSPSYSPELSPHNAQLLSATHILQHSQRDSSRMEYFSQPLDDTMSPPSLYELARRTCVKNIRCTLCTSSPLLPFSDIFSHPTLSAAPSIFSLTYSPLPIPCCLKLFFNPSLTSTSLQSHSYVTPLRLKLTPSSRG